jgi:hypothetical protein
MCRTTTQIGAIKGARPKETLKIWLASNYVVSSLHKLPFFFLLIWVSLLVRSPNKLSLNIYFIFLNLNSYLLAAWVCCTYWFFRIEPFFTLSSTTEYMLNFLTSFLYKYAGYIIPWPNNCFSWAKHKRGNIYSPYNKFDLRFSIFLFLHQH